MKNQMNDRENEVFRILKKDHEEVAQLMQKIQRLVGKETRDVENLCLRLRDSLDAHTLVEEEILYPLLEENEATENLALQAERAHDEIKTYLDELEEITPPDELWESNFRELQRTVLAHVKEEEEVIFPQMKKVFSAVELDEMAERMRQFKSENEAA